MARYHAFQLTYEEVTVLEIPMIFTEARIDRSTVPAGLYLYEVRHDDDMQGDPCQIGKWILVNHWGSVISNQPIELEPSTNGNAYRDIDPENDWNYEGTTISLKEYMARHPPQQQKEVRSDRER